MRYVLEQQRKKLSAACLVATLALSFVTSGVVFAAEAPDRYGSVSCHTDSGEVGVWVSIAVTTVDGQSKHCIPNKSGNIPINQSVIFIYLTNIIKFLSVGAGILAVGGVVWGGITYATARGNPGQIQKAVTTIISSVVGLVLLFLLVAIFNYLIPGKIFY
jgi:hypothetical protein